MDSKLDIKYRPSPNFSSRPDGGDIDMVVLHYTGMRTGEDALERLCDKESEVSSHYLIAEDGTIYQLVQDDKRAWHAGQSAWRGKDQCNNRSIGIEIVNPGHEWGYRPFPAAQMQSVLRLCKELIRKYAISARNIVGHSDIAPTRKQDPGELFPWEWLAENGVGLWVAPDYTKDMVLLTRGDEGENVELIQKALAYYGYSIECSGKYDLDTALIVTTFKRHFCPERVNDKWDGTAAKSLLRLIKMTQEIVGLETPVEFRS
ncbi:MAG: N-acetylmuramoyl-L-alanine amidase [Alphaproteobacteria bacterium]|nr:N-acetylmuramoyl-L-alanine amidase [Alphaproteobacteria bacterium]